MRFILSLLIVASISTHCAYGQSARSVEVKCNALFPFDPLTDRYLSGSLSQVAQYVVQWREYDTISLKISYKPMVGYQIYHQMVDSTLAQRVLNYFAPYHSVDSTKKPIDFSDMPHSKEFQEYFKNDIQSVKRFFSTPITVIQDTLKIEDSYYGPSSFASLFHSFQQEISGCDISFFAPPKATGSLTGEVFITDIYSLFRFDNRLVVVELTGKEILEYLERIYSARYHRLRGVNSDLVRYRTPYYLHLSMAGACYWVNLTKQKYIYDFSLSLERSYNVVMNSFQARDFEKSSSEIGDYRVLLLKWLQGKGEITPKIIENWRLTPERWVEEIAARERSTVQQH